MFVKINDMKSILRSFIYNFVGLYSATLAIPGFHIAGGIQFLALAGAALTLLNFFLKPLIKILFFPINFITLGLFAWVVNVLIIYLLIFFVPQITITPWTFTGLRSGGFVIPAFYFTKFLTVVAVSFVTSLSTSVLNWIGK